MVSCSYLPTLFGAASLTTDTVPVLRQIFLLSTQGNSQCQMARILGVTQGCVSKVRWRIRQQRPSYQRKRGDRQKISTPVKTVASYGQDEPKNTKQLHGVCALEFIPLWLRQLHYLLESQCYMNGPYANFIIAHAEIGLGRSQHLQMDPPGYDKWRYVPT